MALSFRSICIASLALFGSRSLAQQNPIFLHDDPDTPQRLSDPGVAGFNTGGLTPSWGGDILWKTFPKEVLRRSCPDTMSVTGIEISIHDTNFITPAAFANVWITGAISTALGIEPDPANVLYSSGPVFPFVLPGCNCQTFSIPLGNCSTLGLPTLTADGTQDYCVVVAYMPLQTAVPFVPPCFAGDYASVCSSSTDDMFAYSGATSAFSGANKGAAWAPFLLPISQSVGIELEFCEPTINISTRTGLVRKNETAGVHASWTVEKVYAYRVDAQQSIGSFAFAASSLFPPLPSPVIAPHGLCILLNPTDSVINLTLQSGVLVAPGTFESAFAPLPATMIGLCAWSQGFVLDFTNYNWESTQVWKTCVWP